MKEERNFNSLKANKKASKIDLDSNAIIKINSPAQGHDVQWESADEKLVCHLQTVPAVNKVIIKLFSLVWNQLWIDQYLAVKIKFTHMKLPNGCVYEAHTVHATTSCCIVITLKIEHTQDQIEVFIFQYTYR